VRRVDDPTALVCRLSRNLGALTSWTPQGHVGLFRGYFTFFLPLYYYCALFCDALSEIGTIFSEENATHFITVQIQYKLGIEILKWYGEGIRDASLSS
jgi:hypothetical protein